MRPVTIVLTGLMPLVVPACVLAQGEAGEKTDSPRIEYKLANVVAKVNDHVITDDQLYQRMFKTYGAQVLGQMISELLVQDEAASLNIQIKDQDLDARVSELTAGYSSPEEFDTWLASQRMTMDDVKAQVRLGMLQEKVIIEAREIGITTDEVDEFFEANKDQLGIPPQYHLRHILVPTEAEIQEVLVALQAGADFAKLAALKSHDAGSRDKGGDLGFVSLSALAPQLQEALAGVEQGEISPVAATDFGFHVLKVEEIKPAVPAVLDKKTRSDLEAFLLKSKVDAAMPEYMQALHAKATVSLSGVAKSP
ncbi:peptidyl-prolyl cis-trans isomerase [Candidatus Fermentibacteria bacterium]|nr:peptidyl-prolyl cis-trans isomerase [Candidatus Fermentibacteria bacterium]